MSVDHEFYRATNALQNIGAIPSPGGKFSRKHLEQQFQRAITPQVEQDYLLNFLAGIDLLQD